MSTPIIGINPYMSVKEADALVFLVNPTTGKLSTVTGKLFRKVRNKTDIICMLNDIIAIGYIPFSISIKDQGNHPVREYLPEYYEKVVSRKTSFLCPNT